MALLSKDETLKEQVESQLRWDSRVNEKAVTVTVSAGIVTLEGEVPSYRALDAAADTVILIPGVKGLRNNLTVQYPGAVVGSDETIRKDVMEALRTNPDVDQTKLTVSVEDGVVTLEGSADTFWHKMVALGDAQGVLGVLTVRDKIAVVPTERPSDEMIATSITEALERNYAVDPNDVDLTVEEGNVTLDGNVPTWNAKLEAFNTACFTPGVTSVEDNIGISEVKA